MRAGKAYGSGHLTRQKILQQELSKLSEDTISILFLEEAHESSTQSYFDGKQLPLANREEHRELISYLQKISDQKPIDRQQDFFMKNKASALFDWSFFTEIAQSLPSVKLEKFFNIILLDGRDHEENKYEDLELRAEKIILLDDYGTLRKKADLSLDTLPRPSGKKIPKAKRSFFRPDLLILILDLSSFAKAGFASLSPASALPGSKVRETASMREGSKRDFQLFQEANRKAISDKNKRYDLLFFPGLNDPFSLQNCVLSLLENLERNFFSRKENSFIKESVTKKHEDFFSEGQRDNVDVLSQAKLHIALLLTPEIIEKAVAALKAMKSKNIYITEISKGAKSVDGLSAKAEYRIEIYTPQSTIFFDLFDRDKDFHLLQSLMAQSAYYLSYFGLAGLEAQYLGAVVILLAPSQDHFDLALELSQSSSFGENFYFPAPASTTAKPEENSHNCTETFLWFIRSHIKGSLPQYKDGKLPYGPGGAKRLAMLLDNIVMEQKSIFTE